MRMSIMENELSVTGGQNVKFTQSFSAITFVIFFVFWKFFRVIYLELMVMESLTLLRGIKHHFCDMIFNPGL